MTGQPTKCSYLGVGFWHGELQDGSYNLVTWVNSFLRHMMCKIYYLRLEKGTLGGFQLEIEFSEVLQYYPKTLQVFFLCMAIYYHIIQIDDAVGQIRLSQHVLH